MDCEEYRRRDELNRKAQAGRHENVTAKEHTITTSQTSMRTRMMVTMKRWGPTLTSCHKTGKWKMME